MTLNLRWSISKRRWTMKTSRAFLLIALRRIAEAHGGIAHVARLAGIERASLHRALSGRGNPRFSTLAAVAKAVGLRLTVEAVPNK